MRVRSSFDGEGPALKLLGCNLAVEMLRECDFINEPIRAAFSGNVADAIGINELANHRVRVSLFRNWRPQKSWGSSDCCRRLYVSRVTMQNAIQDGRFDVE